MKIKGLAVPVFSCVGNGNYRVTIVENCYDLPTIILCVIAVIVGADDNDFFPIIAFV